MLRLKKWHRLQSVDLDSRNVRTDSSPSYFTLAQKKKWARTHRTRPPRFEQAENYTESKQHKQGAGKARIWCDFEALFLDLGLASSSWLLNRQALSSPFHLQSVRPHC